MNNAISLTLLDENSLQLFIESTAHVVQPCTEQTGILTYELQAYTYMRRRQ